MNACEKEGASGRGGLRVWTERRTDLLGADGKRNIGVPEKARSRIGV